jgi:putative hydrolase of the HAD superfamily
MTIKAIIFDLGRVLLNINPKLTAAAFVKLGANQLESASNKKEMVSAQKKLETGSITPKQFRQEVQDVLDISVSDEEFDAAWNAMLQGIPFERILLLKKLQNSQYPLYLFSNTNAIHYKKILEIYKMDSAPEEFNSFFNRQYYSHIIGMSKPNPESFKRILEENRLNPVETLFIDDLLENIEGAQSVGLQVLHLTSDKSILNLEDYISEINQLTDKTDLEDDDTSLLDFTFAFSQL